MSIEVRNLRKSFGDFVALNDVSLEVPAGELVALLGPSGSGKTTLLRIIAGLEPADGGSIHFHGEDATAQPVRERIVERDGVKLYAAQWGTAGPWLAFAQPFQIVHSQMLKAAVPYLSQHFRVLTMDGRGNGRSDRPQGQPHYSFDHFHDDFVAVLDAFEVERAALVGISAAAMIVLRVAAEQPQRVTHVITQGGFAESRISGEAMAKRMAMETALVERDWAGYVDFFMSCIFSEPHSTKPYEDGVRYAWATRREVIQWVRQAWLNQDLRDHARRVTCPTLRSGGRDVWSAALRASRPLRPAVNPQLLCPLLEPDS